jgi:hypothetical protein
MAESGVWADAIRADMEANPDDYAWMEPTLTGSFTGRKGNEGWAYYDPATDQYVRVTADQKNDAGKMYAYTNKYGDQVWGLKPEGGFYDVNIQGESSLAQTDPFYGKGEYIKGPDTGTPVPSDPVPNPDYDPNNPPGYDDLPDGGLDVFFGDTPNDGSDDYFYDNPNYGDNDSGGGGGDFIYDDDGNLTSNPDNAMGGGGGGGGGGTSGGSGVYNGGTGGNTSWDWSKFESRNPTSPDAPPYEANFTLGEDSPWGNEGTPGGNAEFYNKQFNNLTRQSQAHQQQQLAAGIRRSVAAQNPQEPPQMDWSWANNGEGLKTVREAGQNAAGNATLPGYSLREGFTAGETTNYDIMQAAINAGRFDDTSGYPLSPDNPQLSGTNWSSGANPQDLYSQIPEGADPTWSNMIRNSMDYAFRNSEGKETPAGGGPTAAPGYAYPI